MDATTPAEETTADEPCQDVGLVHVTDSQPGIRRRRAGKGFYFLDMKGKRIRNPEELARIRSLAIPPAWEDIWICPLPEGHIQATGRDRRGRKQYRYHPDWTALRDTVKFASLVGFAEKLPTLRMRVETGLRLRGMPREKVLSAIVRLLDKTLIRIGNETYRKENRSFGLTTLSSRHVETAATSIRFSFRGKSGREWKLKLVDRRVANVVAAIGELPGQHLFQFVDGDQRLPVHSHDVNDYIRETTGGDFTSKHFRTWAATVLAAALLAQTDRPDRKQARTRTVKGIVDQVARELRNTRAVCRRGYIHPALFDAFERGTLRDDLECLRGRFRKPLRGLDQMESLVLRWLRSVDDSGPSGKNGR